MTRTYTYYWVDQDVTTLRAEYERLEQSYDDRKAHIGSDAKEAMETRLRLLKASIDLLVEPVPE